jgi:MinD superfamily P-loop ATPase
MRLAIASGKGGTGKTTVSAALVSLWTQPVVAVDLDVEEPNLHLFLKPEIQGRQKAFLEVPVVDETKCTCCGLCTDLCQFKAISLLGDIVLTFPEMCHGCGGCLAVCPEGALSGGARELGEIRWGRAGKAGFIMGALRIGEAMSPPLMRQVKAKLAEQYKNETVDIIIDAPPGVSCPAVNAVMDSDAILLVTEPTPFGAYDLKLAYEAFLPLGKPLGVVVNRAGIGDSGVYEFCRSQGIEILAEIPFDRRIAEAYCRGDIVPIACPQIKPVFVSLMNKVFNWRQTKKEACVA